MEGKVKIMLQERWQNGNKKKRKMKAKEKKKDAKTLKR